MAEIFADALVSVYVHTAQTNPAPHPILPGRLDNIQFAAEDNYKMGSSFIGRKFQYGP